VWAYAEHVWNSLSTSSARHSVWPFGINDRTIIMILMAKIGVDSFLPQLSRGELLHKL
jgi:hypothetical protein